MTNAPNKRPYSRQSNEDSRNEWNAFRDRVRELGMEALPQIVERYGQTTLKQTAPGVMMGCCPFHVEKSPSFQVSNKGYNCFGAGCDAKGDVFTFMKDKCGMSFRDALLEVASFVGVTPPENGFKRDYTPGPAPVKAPVDPAAEYLADPTRLGAHDLRPVPGNMFVPKPQRFVSLFREAKVNQDGTVEREARVMKYKPEMVHQYRDVNDVLKLVILRLRFSDGKKIFFPLRVEPPLPETPANLVRDGLSWHVKNTGNESRRPVYGAQNLRAWIADPNRGPIVAVEGEKCADYMERMFPEPGTLILSASGGFNANMLADWKELTDLMAESGVVPKRFVVWPDAEPDREFRDGTILNTQELYAKQVASGFLRDLWSSFGNSSVSEDIDFARVIPPEGVEKGWDAADAVDEGWTKSDLEGYISAAVPVDLSHMAGHAPETPASEASQDSDMSMST